MNRVNNNEKSIDSQAIILLCSNLAINPKIDDVKPFTAVQWGHLAKNIFNSSVKTPGNLFGLNREEIQEKLNLDNDNAERINKLLMKAGQLSFKLNELNNIGIRIITRADKLYPHKLKEKLKEKCPPILYYYGDINLLNNKFVGVVGSRNIDEDILEFTKKIGRKIVSENYCLVSGGARGVDSISMQEVLNNSGKAIAFIADSLLSRVKKKDIREAATEGRILLFSANNPATGFTVYSAMDRNKYIYCLSDFTVVCGSDYNKGGTWTGAKENLHNNWVPILVRNAEKSLKGNKELIQLGGIPFNENDFNQTFADCINFIDKAPKYGYTEDLLSIAQHNEINNVVEDKKQADKDNSNLLKVDEKSAVKETKDKTNEDNDVELINSSNMAKESNDVIKEKKEIKNFDAYYMVLNNLKEYFMDEHNADEFKETFNINKTQASSWLKRAVEEKVLKKKQKPVRYITIK